MTVIKTKHIAPPSHFKQALREFNKLEGVKKDPQRRTMVGDLVHVASFTLFLYDNGGGNLTAKQATQIQRFVAKYKEK